MIAVHHCAHLVHFSTENTILSSKSRRDRFKTAIFSWLFGHVFTLKSLLERLKRDFDGSKTVSFQFKAIYRFLISTCYFAHLHGLNTEDMIPDLLTSAVSI